MKYYRLVLAVLLTLVLLYIARKTAQGRPEHFEHQESGFTFEITTVPKLQEGTSGRLPVTIRGPVDSGTTLMFRLCKYGRKPDRYSEYAEAYLLPDSTRPDTYYASVHGGKKGDRTFYFFEVRDANQRVLASFKRDNGQAFMLKFVGHVPALILIGHILLMFAAVFCVTLAAIYAVPVIRNGGNPKVMARLILLAAVLAIAGGYPMGFAMNHYAFGTLWEGVPFGTDVTDNKTQLLVLYFIFVALSSLGTITDGRWGRDLFTPATLGRLTVGALLFLLVVYLIPHSIQFAGRPTYIACYSLIGLMALAYVVAWLRSRQRR